MICISQPGVAILLSKGDVLAQHFLAEHGWISHLLQVCCSLLSFLHMQISQALSHIAMNDD